MNKRFMVSIGLICLAYSQANAEKRQVFTDEYGLAHAIADHWVRSFPADQELTEEEKAAKKGQKLWKAEMPKVSPRQKAATILQKIYANTEAIKQLEDHYTTLNEYSWDDLKILYGTRSAPEYHLVSRVNKACTTFGEAALAALLVTPVSDIEQLRERQAFLKALINTPTRMKRMRDALTEFQPSVEGMVSFWTDNDPLFSGPYEELMNQLFYYKYLFPLNSSAPALETSKRLLADLSIGLYTTFPVGFAYMAFIKKNMYEKFGFGVYAAGSAYVGKLLYEQFSSPLYYLAKRLADVKHFVEAAEKLDRLVRTNDELEKVYGHKLKKLRALLTADRSSEMGQLIANLTSMNLDHWSFFFKYNGLLLRTYKLFMSLRDKLNDGIFEVGQLDAYLSIAQLVADSSENRNGFHFAQYLARDEQPTPYLSITNMWNPFLDPDKAVPNSFEMDSVKGIRNAVVTGPNAGGKSVFITGLATSVLLAQTFGIVAAERAVITPFNKISTYINLTDDIAEGKSLFMAEVKRAQDQLDTLSGLIHDEFSFSIMDELFSGTNPVEGEAAAYSIAHHMGKFKNGLNVLATHFPRLMLLEERAAEDGFKNFKVIVHRNQETGELQYPFTITPGKSNQTIAIDILVQEGYDSSLLDEARDIIDNPDKYKATFN